MEINSITASTMEGNQHFYSNDGDKAFWIIKDEFRRFSTYASVFDSVYFLATLQPWS
jgi:hypothetical protein